MGVIAMIVINDASLHNEIKRMSRVVVPECKMLYMYQDKHISYKKSIINSYINSFLIIIINCW